MFSDYCVLVTLYEIGEVRFRLLGTNGFHAKANNGRFTAAGSRCRENLKNENLTSSFGRLRQNMTPKSVPHVQHDYFCPFNQSKHWFAPSSFLKIPIYQTRKTCSSKEEFQSSSIAVRTVDPAGKSSFFLHSYMETRLMAQWTIRLVYLSNSLITVIINNGFMVSVRMSSYGCTQ